MKRKACGRCTALTISKRRCKNKSACGLGSYKYCRIHAKLQKGVEVPKRRRTVTKRRARRAARPTASESGVNWITGEGLARLNLCESGVQNAQAMGHDIFGKKFSPAAWQRAYAQQVGSGSLNPCLATEKCLRMNLWRKWAFVKHLGEGASGSVILVRNRGTGTKRVAKLSKKFKKAQVQREFDMQNEFWRHGLAPKAIELAYDEVRHGNDHKKVSVILMQRVDSTLESWLHHKRAKWELDVMLNVLIAFIDKMQRDRLTHGDLHWQNVAFKYKQGTKTIGRVVLIDFGSASRKADPRMEFAQLIRTTHKDFENMSAVNGDYVRKRLMVEFKRRFNVSKVDYQLVDDIYFRR